MADRNASPNLAALLGPIPETCEQAVDSGGRGAGEFAKNLVVQDAEGG